jgi:predicted metal-dependent enzyme (double-stranded beta helix superfamily)
MAQGQKLVAVRPDACCPGRLRDFVVAATRVVERGGAEPDVLAVMTPLLAALVGTDDWLPPEFAAPSPDRYCQYLLHCDPLERFSVVSFVWAPGQHTPVHDHTVWGLIGQLRGAERAERFTPPPELRPLGADLLEPGMVGAVSPSIGDVHRVCNALDDRASISIHVYGGNIGRIPRHTFDPLTGEAKRFVSGYVNAVLPNIWSAAP